MNIRPNDPPAASVAPRTTGMGSPSSNLDEWKVGDGVTVTGILA